MRIEFEDGTIREVEGLDINVWNADVLGDGRFKGIVVSAYPSYKDADGSWMTDISGPHVFSAETNLDPEVWGEDEWFTWTDSDEDREFPAEVFPIVNNVLKELVR